MTISELTADTRAELAKIKRAEAAAGLLYDQVSLRASTTLEKAAAAHLMASIYTGIERALQALADYYDVPVPGGERWHADLMALFCEPATPPLPVLFSGEVEAGLIALRRFRHVVRHAYAFDLDEGRLLDGLRKTHALASSVRAILENHLRQLT
jgi:hypothetical protein